MRLNTKLLLAYTVVGGVLLAGIGYFAYANLRQEKLDSIYDGFVAQLRHVDWALTNFLLEVEYDVLTLVENDLVRTRDDGDFTSFLEADETTFEYNVGETEQAIIDVLNTYRLEHPYVNSVYMGRENGSFVRSHPRARPTQYDPRERPWYELGISQPDQVMRTTPYRSVTTPDVNIGTVKALVDDEGIAYGVVGIDITLHSLTDYMANIPVGQGGYIVLVDDNGIALTGQAQEARFKPYDEAGLNYFEEAMGRDSGYTTFTDGDEEHFFFYYTSPALGWKIGAVVPEQEIDSQVRLSVNRVIGLLAFSFLLLIFLSALSVRLLIVNPIKELEQNVKTIIQTGDLDHSIPVHSQDEIGQLATSFGEMVASIKKAGADLRGSEEKYRSLVDNINVGIFSSTAEGRLLHANSAAVRMLGYQDSSELSDIPLVELYEDPQDRERLLQQLTEGQRIKDYEVRLLQRDGTPIWASTSVTAQYDEQGRILLLEGVIEDITARREAEGALRRAHDELEHRVDKRTEELVGINILLTQEVAERKQAEEALQSHTERLEIQNAELDAFAHTVAHNLKQPVGTLLGYAEALEQEAYILTEDSRNKFLRIIGNHGRKISTIVDELLLLASVREAEQIETYPLDMERIVAEARGRLLYLVEDLEGEIILPDGWPLAEGHAPWVEEVWVNYISNALKYGGSPPRVELGATAVGNSHIRFWVRDNGRGLSPEEQARLFTPFERLHQVRAKGHGLGLSIVQRIAYRLGGQVGVKSPPPGSDTGCLFFFTLPVFPLD
jgi:PAS domain S-box-containing protein